MFFTETLYKQIFFPFEARATQRVSQTGGRFAYYTNAETAYKILKNQEIWMRHTRVMNDYLEVEHGLECIRAAHRHSDAGNEFDRALDSCFPDISKEIADLFDSWAPIIRQHTYVTCFSEHSSDDDEFGRLSMWRAYGGSSGVALILNAGAMLRPSDALQAHSTPVAYMNAADVANELKAVAKEICANIDYVQSLGATNLKRAIFDVFRYASICTKHRSFEEEREWRVITTRILQKSQHLTSEVELIGGIPQNVLKIKLQDHPEENLTGLQIASLIDRILIGPCEYPETIKAALSQILINAGVEDAETKIQITGIPLRPNQR